MDIFGIIMAITGPIAGLFLMLVEKRDTMWSKFWFGMGFLNVFVFLPINIIVHLIPWLMTFR